MQLCEPSAMKMHPGTTANHFICPQMSLKHSCDLAQGYFILYTPPSLVLNYSRSFEFFNLNLKFDCLSYSKNLHKYSKFKLFLKIFN
jgi:hypothetical protein